MQYTMLMFQLHLVVWVVMATDVNNEKNIWIIGLSAASIK